MIPSGPAVGTLKHLDRDESIPLRSRCLIGRASTCDVRVDDARVSSEHASVSWTGTAWELRDLGSKNGTFLGGRRLGPGERRVLAAGDAFHLGGGSGPGFCLVESTAPVASARHVASGLVRRAASGLLVLPDEDRPLLSLVEGRDGRWILESDGGVRPAEDREIVVVDGEAYSLDLPAPHGPTQDAGGSIAPLDQLTLRFRVSRDEERVEITVCTPNGELYMPPRSYHYLLLTLARARIEDTGSVPAEAGFRDRADLCRMLAMDEYRLNVDVCRARKQFAVPGLLGGANIVERRTGTGRMRIGVSRVEIEREADG